MPDTEGNPIPDERTSPEEKAVGPQVTANVDKDKASGRKFSSSNDYAGMIDGKSQPAT